MRSHSYLQGPAPAVVFVALIAVLFQVLPARAGPGPAWSTTLIVRAPRDLLGSRPLPQGDFTLEDTPGKPALPVYTALVELPDGAWSLSVRAGAVELLTLAEPVPAAPGARAAWDGGAPASPGAPPDRLASVELPDANVYGADAFYPAERVAAGPDHRQAGRSRLPVRVYPFRYNPVRRVVEYTPEISVTITVAAGQGTATERPEAAAAALTSAAPAAARPDAVRVRTKEAGIHRLTYAELAAAGAPLPGAAPADFAMDYLGEPVDIEVTGAGDGRFDPGDLVLFYAEKYGGRFANHNVYRFYWNAGDPRRMAQRAAPAPPGEPLTQITRTAHLEFDRAYYSNYSLETSEDHFFDNPLYVNDTNRVVSTTYTFDLDAPLPVGSFELAARFHGGEAQPAAPDQSVSLTLNGSALGVYRWDGSVAHRALASGPASQLAPLANRLVLEAALAQLPGSTSYWVSPDGVDLAYPAAAVALNDRLHIESLPVTGGAASVDVTGFTGDAVRAYDVRDARHPVRLTTVETSPAGATPAGATPAGATPAGASYRARFWDDALSSGVPPAYFLTTVGGALAPLGVEADAASSWGTPAHTADYIAIVHRSLWEAIDPLLAHRAAEGLRVAKVDVQDIYDEFSGGRLEPQAVRDFLTYVYHTWNDGVARPEYVLLVGDGHYDFKGAVRPDLPVLIPPYLMHVDPFIGETAADNRYVSVDGPADILPDMALGRIPARRPEEVTALVNKILAYETAPLAGDWRRRVVYVADNDDDEAGDFHALSDRVRHGTLPTSYESRGIYYRSGPALDTGEQVRAAVRSAFNEGALFLQWFGHASRYRWGSVRMFDVTDPPTLNNRAGLPATASFSCWSGYYIGFAKSPADVHLERSLAEALVLEPARGSLVDLSPSGLHVGDALLILDEGLTTALFDRREARFGKAADAAKLEVFRRTPHYRDLIDTMLVFGDPATRLQLPPAIYYLPVAPVGAGLP